MQRGSPAAVAASARPARCRAPLGSPRTTMAAPSAASSTMRLAGASSAAVTATTASSCARRRACSWTGLRANSWIFRKTTLARVATAFAVFICQEPTVLRSYRLPTPCAYNPQRDSVTDLEREQGRKNDRTQGRQPRAGCRGHQQERQAGEHSLAGARHDRLRRARAPTPQRVPCGSERRGHVHDQGRDESALPHARRRGESGARPRRRDHLLPGRSAALAALLARLVPARAGAQAPLRREGPLLLVLRELPRRAVPSGPPRRRLPRGPGVARLRGVLFGRVAPHLRKMRPRHAEACRLAVQGIPSAAARASHPQDALGVAVRDLLAVRVADRKLL